MVQNNLTAHKNLNHNASIMKSRIKTADVYYQKLRLVRCIQKTKKVYLGSFKRYPGTSTCKRGEQAYKKQVITLQNEIGVSHQSTHESQYSPRWQFVYHILIVKTLSSQLPNTE